MAQGFLLSANQQLAAHGGQNNVDPLQVWARAKEAMFNAARWEIEKASQGRGRNPSAAGELYSDRLERVATALIPPKVLSGEWPGSNPWAQLKGTAPPTEYKSVPAQVFEQDMRGVRNEVNRQYRPKHLESRRTRGQSIPRPSAGPSSSSDPHGSSQAKAPAPKAKAHSKGQEKGKGEGARAASNDPRYPWSKESRGAYVAGGDPRYPWSRETTDYPAKKPRWTAHEWAKWKWQQ